jgi:two-component system, OmpR family, phosphate regulon sensor histidine kinase PhoR
MHPKFSFAVKVVLKMIFFSTFLLTLFAFFTLLYNTHYTIRTYMNQKIIWLIIGLLTIAVIGVMSLQLKFILDARADKEDQFNSHVKAALKNVASMIEKVEDKQMFNGFSISHFEQSANGFSVQSTTISTDPAMVNQKKLEAGRFQEEMGNRSIEERINLPQLDGFLKQELADRGIKIPFSYGVFSNKENSFVIFNNKYIIPQANQGYYDFLKTSDHKTTLFNVDLNPPGMLMLHFPTETQVIWAGLWKILLLSLFFVGVIMGCFIYTILVIFRQKKLSEMKNDFINNMTHEFKTPIATISLASDSITNALVINNPDKVRRFADIIKQENKRMNGQVEKVLQMALIERDTIKLNFTSINLHEVINQALGNISLQVEKKDGVVSSNLNADRPVVEGDMNHISNVINNLLDNANKYSPEKPDIIVSTRNVSNGVEFTVTDKGIGMTKEAKKKIFEKFYRVHTGNLHDVKGFGLGLSYVKAMVTAHKGSIDVKSEPSKGSSFIIFLPFHVSQEGLN